jgi:GTP 3',8-cyclase
LGQGDGEVGVIASVTEPFCGDCTRARLSADGRLFSCLFAQTGLNLRQELRAGLDDVALGELARKWWSARTDRYSEMRSSERETTGRKLPMVSSKVEMSFIGG